MSKILLRNSIQVRKLIEKIYSIFLVRNYSDLRHFCSKHHNFGSGITPVRKKRLAKRVFKFFAKVSIYKQYVLNNFTELKVSGTVHCAMSNPIVLTECKAQQHMSIKYTQYSLMYRHTI